MPANPGPSPSPSLCLFGTPDDTGNLGVRALNRAVVGALSDRQPDLALALFDFHSRPHAGVVTLGDGRSLEVLRLGARHSKRMYLSTNLKKAALGQRFGLTLGTVLPAIKAADAVLDVSGGDSFTDLYGRHRFELVTIPKELSLQAGVPLILLPQTYGPFHRRSSATRARRVVSEVAMAWARDDRSYTALQELAGDSFDPARHRRGVDLAFLLPPAEPPDGLVPPSLRQLLERHDRPLAGVNISGLLWNSPDATDRYGLKGDYRQLVLDLVASLARSGADVILVPHVVVATDDPESDFRACLAALDHMPPELTARVRLAPEFCEPSWVKWLIAHFDWFCGTRMHATIAALSSGVPAAAIAYSGKTLGVFETCGLGDAVGEAHLRAPSHVLEVVLRSWEQRELARVVLAERLEGVRFEANGQIDAIVAAVVTSSAACEPA